MDNSIIGKSHLQYVQDQIKVRQEVLGKKSRSSADIAWANGNSSWVRLASSVDISNEDILVYNTGSSKWEPTPNDGAQFRASYLDIPEYSGNELASQMVLQGGILNENGSQKFGVSNSNSILPSNGSNYGFGGTDFGIRAMPGIISFETTTQNKGSLRFATVQIKANNKKQFEYLEALYMRVGYTLLLEWGNTTYPIVNKETSQTTYENNRYSLVSEFLNNPPQNSKGTSYFYTQIEKYREQSQGNYDGFLGKLTNFSWEFTKDGTYLITLKLITIGSVVESLKVNLIQDSLLFSENNSKSSSKKNQKQNSLLNLISNITQPIPISTSLNPSWFSPFNMLLTPGGSAANFVLSYLFDATSEKDLTYKSTKKYSDDYAAQTPPQTLPSGSVDNVYACSATFGDSKFIKYLRFGHLLDIINSSFLVYGEGEDNEPILFKIDSSLSQYCFSNGQSISSDPTKMIVRFGGEYLGTKIDIFNEGENAIEKFHTEVEGVQVGLIPNLYFSYEFLESSINSNTDPDTGTLSLYSFLRSLTSEVNQLLGGLNKLNFRLVDKKVDDKTIVEVIEFYDEVSPFEVNKLRNQRDEEPKLIAYGFGPETYNDKGQITSPNKGGFITDYQFKTEISKNLGTMIAIGAQSNGQSVGEDATLFSKWNYGLVDRILPKKLDIDKKIKQTDEDTNSYLKLISAYQDYVYSFAGSTNSNTATKEENNIIVGDIVLDFVENFTGYGFPNCNLVSSGKSENSLIGFIETQKSYFQKFYSLEAIGKKTSTPFIGFIPMGLTLTMDGLSGLRIFDRLSIDSRFLPPNYGETLDFVITQLDHRIVNNKWETTIGTMSIPKLFEKLELNLKDILNILPPITTGFEDLVGFFGYDYSTLGNLILNSIQYKKDNPGLGTGDTIRTNTNGTLTLPGQNLGEGFAPTPLVEIGTSSRNSGSYGWLRVSVPGKGWVTSKGLYLANAPGYRGTNGTGTWHLAEPAALKLLEFAQFCEQQGKSYQINSAYRTYAEQEAGYNENPKTHAAPGGSPHGLGGAIDIQQLISRRPDRSLTANPTINQTFRKTNPDYKFWEENAPRYGWYNPLRLKDGYGQDETWHWEFWGVPGEQLQIQPPQKDAGVISTVSSWFDVKYLSSNKVPNNNALAVHGRDAKLDENGKPISFQIED